MNIIEFKNVSKFFFTQKLFENVNLEINKNDKIAILGNNGVGKSTLIRLIMDEELPDTGDIIINNDYNISCFDQFGRIDMSKKVKNLLDIPFEKVISLQVELENLSSQFGDNDKENEILLEKYSVLSDKFESMGGYSYLHIQSEFADLFDLSDKLEKSFKELSGGERQYIRLAISLFSEADFIILDEPLSFFDKKKTAWLSDYISNSNKAFLVISHNVDFIRSFSNKIFNIDNYSITSYECDYSQYLKEKKVKIAKERKINIAADLIIEKTLKAMDKKQDLIDRIENKRGQAVILRRMERELEKLGKGKIEFSKEYKYEYKEAPKESLLYGKELESDEIVVLTSVSKEYPDKILYKDVNFKIFKDSKVCIVGENGSGKSTLLKILKGEEEATTGKVSINKNAKISFIAQETTFENEKISVTEYLKAKTGLSDDFIELAIDSLYNNEPEFRDKRIFMLSGGEKKRLEIFANTISETDLLIIDEPSTYMDEYSRTAVANMLLDYEGAIVLVTHDKFLMKKLNFDIYDIRDKRFRIKEGTF